MELWDGSKDGYVASRFVIEEEGEGVKNWMNQRLLEKVGEGKKIGERLGRLGHTRAEISQVQTRLDARSGGAGVIELP